MTANSQHNLQSDPLKTGTLQSLMHAEAKQRSQTLHDRATLSCTLWLGFRVKLTEAKGSSDDEDDAHDARDD